MEEYDVDLSFHFCVEDNGDIDLTSDIDDQIDYLNPMERTCIITHLLQDLFTQIYNGVEDYDEDDEAYNGYCYAGSELRDMLVSIVINFWYNIFAEKTNEFPQNELEFSMAIYKRLLHKQTKQDFNMVIKTAHSENVNVFEPENAGLAFLQDITEYLLDSGQSKKEVKLWLRKTLLSNLYAMDKYIDDYEKESN